MEMCLHVLIIWYVFTNVLTIDISLFNYLNYINFGQVRILLDQAYSISRQLNAPVVLCGDFNCTPKVDFNSLLF